MEEYNELNAQHLRSERESQYNICWKLSNHTKEILEKQPHQRSLWKTPFSPCTVCAVIQAFLCELGAGERMDSLCGSMGWPQEGVQGKDWMGKNKSRNVCVGSRMGLKSIFKDLCLSRKRKRRHVGS